MSELSESQYSCEECGEDVKEDDDFCTNCGLVFRDDVFCSEHASRPAEGVCLICLRPYCGECGTRAGKPFFCDKHATYEIFERSACIFNSPDNQLSQIAFQVLEEGGYHPFLVPRTIVPVTTTGRLTINVEPGPHLVLVPFREVLGAKELLNRLDIRQ